MKDKEVCLLILIQVERTDGLKSDISNKSGIRTPRQGDQYPPQLTRYRKVRQ
jgi:hypothetical protein